VQALQRGPLGAGHARHLAQRVHRRARHARVRVAAQLAQRRHRRAHHLRACSFVILLCGAGELPSCAHRRAVSSGSRSTQWEQPGPRQARELHQAARQQSRSPPRQARGAIIARLVRTQGAAAGLARSVRACRAGGPEQPRVSGRAERPRRARRGAGRARACCSGRHGTSAPASAAAQARCAGAGRTASSQASASSGPASSSQLPAKRTAATRSCAGGGAEC